MKLLIIGAGPAGEAAAKTARKLNPAADITVIEREFAGGLCLNKGCIPSKTLLERVHSLSENKLPIPWDQLQEAKDTVITTIRSQLEAAFKTLKIKLVSGTATFKSPSSIELRTEAGVQEIPFDKAIIATGTESFFPPPLDQFRDELLSSDEMLDISRTPKSVTVIGGGAIGCEFACLLNAAGASVTIIEMTASLLPGEDSAVTSALQRAYESRGITVKTNTQVSAMKKLPQGWELTFSDGTKLESREVLACVGRVPNHSAMNLSAAGVEVKGRIPVLNEDLQTTNPNIYVAGDAGTTRLAHAASAQGEVAAANAFGEHRRYDDRFVPRCLYSWPEVASVGAWKHQLEAKNEAVKTSRGFFKGSAKALAANETDGFVQIVSDPGTDKILGAQIIGAHATELIHIFSVALKKEMTVKELSEVMFAHPTLSEVIKDAAKK